MGPEEGWISKGRDVCGGIGKALQGGTRSEGGKEGTSAPTENFRKCTARQKDRGE